MKKNFNPFFSEIIHSLYVFSFDHKYLTFYRSFDFDNQEFIIIDNDLSISYCIIKVLNNNKSFYIPRTFLRNSVKHCFKKKKMFIKKYL